MVGYEIMLCFFVSMVASTEVDVLVLGAGYSGLGAALYLEKNNNKNFLVLEANDYIGGRVKNVMIDNASVPLGSGWIHKADENHTVYQLAKKYNLKMERDAYQYADVTFRNGETGEIYPKAYVTSRANYVVSKAREMDTKLEERLESGRYDIDVATGLRWAGYERNGSLDKAIEYFMFDFENGIENGRISATAYGYTGSGEDYIVNDKRGFNYPMMQEIKPIQNKILLNKIITKVKKENGKHTVYVKDGSSYTAKQVLVTFSSGVLNNKVVKFDPPLPSWKTEALAMAPMNDYCKIFLKFKNKFWDNSTYFMLVTKFQGRYMHWQNIDDVFNVTNWVMATLTGAVCRESHKYTDDEIKQQVYDVLNKAFKNASMPIEIVRNNWGENDRFLGAYSYQVAGINEDDYLALEHPVNQTLWFTGEYTGRYEFGYAHGAYSLGGNMAAEMGRCMNLGFCPKNEPKRTLMKEKCVKSSSVKCSSLIFLTIMSLFVYTFL